MAWTTPPTWSSGQVVTAAQLNNYITDNTNFLNEPDRAMAYRSSNQSISDSTWTQMTLGSEQFDTNGMHGASSNYLVAQSDGIYLAIGQVRFVYDASGSRKAMMRKNSGGGAGGGTAWGLNAVDPSPTPTETTFQVVSLIPLGTNDTVDLWVWQDSGGAVNLEGGAEYNWLQLIRLGE